MVAKRFWQVDAFTNQIFTGNAAAVVFDAHDLATETMQQISREMNLSETVFLLRPDHTEAHYKVRIFTPRNELPFAGHPTVAAAFTVISSGTVPKSQDTSTLVQECGIGLVPVDIQYTSEGYRFRMTQAPPQYRSVDLPLDELSMMLGCGGDAFVDLRAEVVSTGVQWLIAPIQTKAQVAALCPDQRTFAPGEGIPEDPVCGSGNGSVAAYIAKHDLLPGNNIHYLAEQGEEIARKGKVWVDITKSDSQATVIQVGGQAVKVIDGVFEL